jgi:hypothetical protein
MLGTLDRRLIKISHSRPPCTRPAGPTAYGPDRPTAFSSGHRPKNPLSIRGQVPSGKPANSLVGVAADRVAASEAESTLGWGIRRHSRKGPELATG